VDVSASMRGRPALLVASTGGHLAQLVRFADLLGVSPDSIFATFDSPQSRSLLSGRCVITLDYVPPRCIRQVARATARLLRESRCKRFDAVLSTGASVALAAYTVGQLRRKRVIFIESVSRFDGPSTTGRILERLPHVDRYCQHASWADRPGWRRVRPLLDDYTAVPITDGAAVKETSGRRIFVSLGTIQPYRFDSLVDAVRSQVRAVDDVTWQLGSTQRDDLPGQVWREVDSEIFDQLVVGSDVFITHAGVGTLLRALELGVRPIVVPRRAHRGEHVDDHQMQVARELADRGLVLLRDPGQLSLDDLEPAYVSIRRTGNA
jgi:UDP-N-acetylglucosamine--N-acetylmuramyl-(pentapeptide) pyrophosphoryl-undecaprenol N-acetylglucosamine transferase